MPGGTQASRVSRAGERPSPPVLSPARAECRTGGAQHPESEEGLDGLEDGVVVDGGLTWQEEFLRRLDAVCPLEAECSTSSGLSWCISGTRLTILNGPPCRTNADVEIAPEERAYIYI